MRDPVRSDVCSLGGDKGMPLREKRNGWSHRVSFELSRVENERKRGRKRGRQIHTPHDITSCESEDEGAAPESISCIYVSIWSFRIRFRKHDMASKSVPGVCIGPSPAKRSKPV